MSLVVGKPSRSSASTPKMMPVYQLKLVNRHEEVEA